LAKQAATRPVLLYFIEKECPCSRDAAVYVDQLQAAFGSAVQVVGLINADGETAAAWKAATKAKFPVLADADLAIAGAFQAERSATTVLVAPGGAIAKVNPGYSAGTFQELTTLIARQARTLAPKLTFTGAPEKLTSGCPLKE
jgi:peroxiredoxin